MRKVFAILIFFVMFAISCGPVFVEAPFFRMKAPEKMVLLDLPEGMRFEIVLGLTKHEIQKLTDITDSLAFMAFDWKKGLYKPGEVSGLGIGTIPPGSSFMAKGQENVGGMLAWCDQVEQKDANGSQTLRIVHNCKIPLDGGLLEIISSVDPRSKVTIEHLKESLRTLDIFDKNYFLDLKNE